MSRGSGDDFDKLHGLTLRILIRMMEGAEKGMLVDEDGHVTMPPPALLAQTIKFLKENGIDSPAAAKTQLETLHKALPTFADEDFDNNVVPIKR